MTERKPETQKTLYVEFDATEKSAKWCRNETEERLIVFRKGAAEHAKCLLMKHGYFNGNIECTVTHEEGVIGVKAVLTCYGLPYSSDDADEAISLMGKESERLANRIHELEQRVEELEAENECECGFTGVVCAECGEPR